MSRFILLQVDVTRTGGYDRNQAVDDILRVATDLCKSNEEIDQLGTGAWLIDVRTSMPFASAICGSADNGKVPYRLLFLEQEPEWITYGNWK